MQLTKIDNFVLFWLHSNQNGNGQVVLNLILDGNYLLTGYAFAKVNPI